MSRASTRAAERWDWELMARKLDAFQDELCSGLDEARQLEMEWDKANPPDCTNPMTRTEVLCILVAAATVVGLIVYAAT